MLDDLALFIDIVEMGSLGAAARKANVPASTLTRRLQKLEQQLNCRLLHRSARRLTPTPEGWQYYERCRPLLHGLRQATSQLDQALHEVSGLVRVLAPLNLANPVLADAWTGFMMQHDGIRLELQLSNHLEDLLNQSADLAIRAGTQSDSQLMQRKLGEIHTRLVAAPSYLRRSRPPETPSDLEFHSLLVAEPLVPWQFHHQTSGQQLQWVPQARLRVNDIDLSVKAAQAGLGILFCPLTLCHAGLMDGSLVEVLPDWRLKPRPIYAIWPQQQHVPARVRALIDYLTHFCAAHPLLNGSPLVLPPH